MDPKQNKLAKPLTIAGIIVLIAGMVGFTGLRKDDGDTAPLAATSTDSNTVTPSQPSASTNTYKDGTYSAEGAYISPGGAEKVGVSLTIENDIVVASTFTAKADREISVALQKQFGEGYKQFVIGKKLDEINVGKVSGASLTPKGFNDAVAKIKVEARS